MPGHTCFYLSNISQYDQVAQVSDCSENRVLDSSVNMASINMSCITMHYSSEHNQLYVPYARVSRVTDNSPGCPSAVKIAAFTSYIKTVLNTAHESNLKTNFFTQRIVQRHGQRLLECHGPTIS